MALDLLLFVSKRLQLVAAAVLCLTAAQCAHAVATEEPPAARVAVTR